MIRIHIEFKRKKQATSRLNKLNVPYTKLLFVVYLSGQKAGRIFF